MRAGSLNRPPGLRRSAPALKPPHPLAWPQTRAKCPLASVWHHQARMRQRQRTGFYDDSRAYALNGICARHHPILVAARPSRALHQGSAQLAAECASDNKALSGKPRIRRIMSNFADRSPGSPCRSADRSLGTSSGPPTQWQSCTSRGLVALFPAD